MTGVGRSRREWYSKQLTLMWALVVTRTLLFAFKCLFVSLHCRFFLGIRFSLKASVGNFYYPSGSSSYYTWLPLTTCIESCGTFYGGIRVFFVMTNFIVVCLI